MNNLFLALSIVSALSGSSCGSPPLTQTPQSQTPQSVLLRFKFHPGESLTYKMVAASDGDQDDGDIEYHSSTARSCESTQLVSSVGPSGTASLAISVSNVKVNQTGGGMRIEDPKLDLKKPFYLTLSPTGDVGGRDIPTGQMGGHRSKLENALSTFFAGGVPVASMPVVTAFPAGKVSAGSHWDGQVGFFGFALQTTVSLDKLATEQTHTIAYITANATFDLPDESGKHKESGKGLVKCHFQYRFDVTSGRILTMRANFEIPDPTPPGSSAVHDPHATSNTMTLKMDIVQ